MLAGLLAGWQNAAAIPEGVLKANKFKRAFTPLDQVDSKTVLRPRTGNAFVLLVLEAHGFGQDWKVYPVRVLFVGQHREVRHRSQICQFACKSFWLFANGVPGNRVMKRFAQIMRRGPNSLG